MTTAHSANGPLATLPDGAMVNSVVDAIRHQVATRGKDVALTFLDGQGHVNEVLTFAQLDAKVQRVAAMLQERNIHGPVAILCEPGIVFIVAFVGAMYAGAIPVPLYPPDLRDLQRAAARLSAILRDSGASVSLTTTAIAQFASCAGAGLSLDFPMDFLPVDDGPSSTPGTSESTPGHVSWKEDYGRGKDIAFLQYTSGSTAFPRGVMVSHSNLLTNMEKIWKRCQLNSEMGVVSWLPPFHDMGLIGSILMPLAMGIPSKQMSPMTFLRRPITWLRAVSGPQRVASSAPSFAYERCVIRISNEDVKTLDLSSWQVALCGAEPIAAATLERFSAHFAPAGFRRSAFVPTYGLAEATLMATAHDAGSKRGFDMVHVSHPALREDRIEESYSAQGNTVARVSCGLPIEGHRIVIVDPHSFDVVPERRVGEIWISGPSVAEGYWRNEAASERFRAYCTNGDGPFLRTGDRGFISQGHVYVVGRLHDLIIVYGRKYAPEDVEVSAREAGAPLLRTNTVGCIVVGSECKRYTALLAEAAVDVTPIGQQEHVANVWGQLAHRIRQTVAEAHGIRIDGIAFFAQGILPRTTSGKIQRHRYLDLWDARSEKALFWDLLATARGDEM